MHDDTTRRAIRAARQNLGWTQSKLAGKAKVDRSKLSLYENGQIELTPEEQESVEDALADARIPKKFADELQRKIRRQKAGLSQQELATLAEISRTKVSKWEGGHLELTPDELAKVEESLAAALAAPRATASLASRMRTGIPSGYTLTSLLAPPPPAPVTEIVRLKEQNRVLQKLVVEQKELIAHLKKMIAAQDEVMAFCQELITETDAKDVRIADLEKRITDLRALYEAETDAALAYDKARELREKILPDKPGEEKTESAIQGRVDKIIQKKGKE